MDLVYFKIDQGGNIQFFFFLLSWQIMKDEDFS